MLETTAALLASIPVPMGFSEALESLQAVSPKAG